MLSAIGLFQAPIIGYCRKFVNKPAEFPRFLQFSGNIFLFIGIVYRYFSGSNPGITSLQSEIPTMDFANSEYRRDFLVSMCLNTW